MPTYVSLFSGCGGLDLGFTIAGYRCLGAYDVDTAAVDTYNHNFPSEQASVADLSGDYLNNLHCHADAVVAGPPCQGFSTIGRRDPTDARNCLLLKPVDFAIASKAKVLVVENVPGALSGTHSTYWNEALTRLRKSGYTAATLYLAAMTAGLAQIRRRIVLVASRRSFNPPAAGGQNPPPLRSVLQIPPGAPNHVLKYLDPTSRAGRIASRIRPGQKLSNVRKGSASVHTWDIPDVFGRVTPGERQFLQTLLVLRRRRRMRPVGDADPVSYADLRSIFGTETPHLLDALMRKNYVRKAPNHRYDLTHTFNGKFRRLHPEQPAHCVLTKFCDPSHFLHPFQMRGFTIREAARLQGFPDTFRFLGSPRQQAVQVGNAVPVPVAADLATWIRAELL